ncbi:retroviral-like aspartic protease family protein [Francisella adeliensis]|uniref:Aspartyl protease n=1 Tax=Francisella adeliensis TaxID=2007306 RepID=A0A2Z4XVM3_9GAMM|nr:retroviral-like aspartic protease family protein [Francisella adeliensis]AXA32904.1 hypothetical protein CDH04_00035 [Francisella adeliensis]MBK2086403.1 aspartyl protease family protein [Francisella adeliensis]MBK2096618.1 aspartyl protease family protein [Francisella adeliensis]QIW11130.1 hypothetical protein FZC43_00035 [Francisella adeliensis]QIW13007.1 hypothetical protein FZC44_00035 [Francisella adeliensis]
MSIFIKSIILLFSLLLVNICVASDIVLSKFLDQYGYEPLKLIDSKETSNAPYIVAKVNGKKAYILLDSGSSGVNIFKNSLAELDLKSSDSSSYSANMTGKVLKDKTVTLKSIDVGNISLENIKSEITNQPKKLSLPTLIFGTKFLEKYNALFDFSTSKVYFTKQSVSPKNHYIIGKNLEAQGYKAIKLNKLLSGHEIITVSFNGNNAVNCLLDTGTSNLTIAEDYAKSIGLKEGEKETIKATDGTLEVSDTYISSLLLNPLNSFFEPRIELKKFDATLANIQAMKNFLGVLCVVGYKELKEVNAVYDFSAGILYIKK